MKVHGAPRPASSAHYPPTTIGLSCQLGLGSPNVDLHNHAIDLNKLYRDLLTLSVWTPRHSSPA